MGDFSCRPFHVVVRSKVLTIDHQLSLMSFSCGFNVCVVNESGHRGVAFRLGENLHILHCFHKYIQVEGI